MIEQLEQQLKKVKNEIKVNQQLLRDTRGKMDEATDPSTVKCPYCNAKAGKGCKTRLRRSRRHHGVRSSRAAGNPEAKPLREEINSLHHEAGELDLKQRDLKYQIREAEGKSKDSKEIKRLSDLVDAVEINRDTSLILQPRNDRGWFKVVRANNIIEFLPGDILPEKIVRELMGKGVSVSVTTNYLEPQLSSSMWYYSSPGV